MLRFDSDSELQQAVSALLLLILVGDKSPLVAGRDLSIGVNEAPHVKRRLLGLPGYDGHRSSFSRQTGVTGCCHEGWDSQLVGGNLASSITGLPRRHWDYHRTCGFCFHE